MLKTITSLFASQDKSIKEQSDKQEISATSINLHNQALAELKVLGSIAKTLDSTSFADPNFQFYLKTCSFFASNKGQYQGLKNSTELLRIAVQAQASFLKIEQTELRYRSLKQQEYYQFVLSILEEKFGAENSDSNELNQSGSVVIQIEKTPQEYSLEEIKQLFREKLAEIQPEIKSEQGKQALADYNNSLEVLAQDKEIGLKLLYLFKKFNLTDFSILKIIADMIAYLQDKDLRNMRAIQDLVMKNQAIFLQLGRIIGVPKNLETAETYARMLQLLALTQKEQKNSVQFFRLLDLLKQWRTFYHTVNDLRQQYPASDYHLPEEFQVEIPAINIYQEYHEYLETFK
jgi:hypothetical protein